MEIEIRPIYTLVSFQTSCRDPSVKGEFENHRVLGSASAASFMREMGNDKISNRCVFPIKKNTAVLVVRTILTTVYCTNSGVRGAF